MTADTNAEIAQIVEAACYSFGFVIFGIYGLIVGGYMPGFMGRKSSAKRTTHRAILWILAAGSFFAAGGIWLLSEHGADFVRSDGKTSEYGRQIAIGIVSLAIVYVYAMYSRYTHAGTLIILFFVFCMYLSTTLASITTTNIHYWILFSFWGVSLVTAGVFGFTNINIQPTYVYGNYIAGFMFLVFATLQGLWIILSQQITRSLSLTVEAGLYTATDILMLVVVGLIMAFTFPMTKRLVNSTGTSVNVEGSLRVQGFQTVRNAKMRKR